MPHRQSFHTQKLKKQGNILAWKRLMVPSGSELPGWILSWRPERGWRSPTQNTEKQNRQLKGTTKWTVSENYDMKGQGCGSAFKSKFKSVRGSKYSRAVKGRGRSHLRPGGSKWSPGGSIDRWSKVPITLKRSWIRIRIEVKNWIRIRFRIRIEAMRIRNPAWNYDNRREQVMTGKNKLKSRRLTGNVRSL